MNESQRVEFEAFMEARFGDCIDRRRCKNGDENDYMSFDMGMARIVWQHMQQKLDAVVDDLLQGMVDAIEKEQERLFEDDYLMDSKECIEVMRDFARQFRVDAAKDGV